MAHMFTEGRWKTFDHLLAIDEKLLDVAAGKTKRLIVEAPVRHGKLCAHDTPVPTPGGFVPHGNLRVGDLVYSPTGAPVPVVALGEEAEADWLVRFADGAEVVTHGAHEWPVRLRGSCPKQRRWRRIESEHLGRLKLRSGAGPTARNLYQVRYPAPLQGLSPNLSMDPYTLGVWLGDGSTSKPAITHHPSDSYVLPYPVSSVAVHRTTGVYTTYYRGLWDDLRATGVAFEKHVPSCFLWASEADRWALLAGLIDTDGHVGKDGRVRFVNCNVALIEAVEHLARSFGWRTSITRAEPCISTSGIRGRQPVWTVGFSPNEGMVPARLPRKARAASAQARMRGIVAAEPTEGRAGRCIQVEGGEYLVGEKMVPTHNSELISHYFPAWWLGRKPNDQIMLVAYNDTFARAWGRKARDTLNAVGPRIFGVRVAEQPAAADWWYVEGHPGVMTTAGMGGSITGKGADCAPGDSLIATEVGDMRLDALIAKRTRPRVVVPSPDGGYGLSPITAVRDTITNELYEITTDSGHRLRVTGKHRVFVPGRGYVEAQNLCTGDQVEIADQHYLRTVRQNNYRRNTREQRSRESRYALPPLPHGSALAKSARIVGIERVCTPPIPVYDLEVAGPRCFFADGVLVHNCLIIDDPVKNAEEANSPTYREKVWDWWQSTVSTRLQPGGAVIVVMARWHEDDLAGRLQLNEGSEDWDVLRLPALAEENDILGRAPGEALCPEMYDRETLEKIRRDKGKYWFSALYDQRPAPAEGFMFKRDHFRYYKTFKDGQGDEIFEMLVKENKDDAGISQYVSKNSCTIFQTVDVAASDKTTSDWSVISTWAATPDRNLLLLGVERQHFETLKLKAFLKRVSDEHDKPRMWIETFGAGKTPHKMMLEMGYPVSELRAEVGTRQDKVARAQAAIALYEAHRVYHPIAETDWRGEFEEELATFPTGNHDDQVDTMAYAARLLPGLSAMQTVRIPQTGVTITGGLLSKQF